MHKPFYANGCFSIPVSPFPTSKRQGRANGHRLRVLFYSLSDCECVKHLSSRCLLNAQFPLRRSTHFKNYIWTHGEGHNEAV
jgi:hypothetical protein